MKSSGVKGRLLFLFLFIGQFWSMDQSVHRGWTAELKDKFAAYCSRVEKAVEDVIDRGPTESDP